MDGQLINDSVQYIKKWIHQYISDDNIDDLHIDEISPYLQNKKFWLSDAIALYKKIYFEFNNYNILLAFELKCSYIPNSIPDIITENSFSNTPPSLYVCKKGNHRLSETIEDSIELENISTDFGLNVYYYETKEPEGGKYVYYRYLFMTCK